METIQEVDNSKQLEIYNQLLEGLKTNEYNVKDKDKLIKSLEVKIKSLQHNEIVQK